MANAVTSFAELSLKAAALRSADNSDFEFQFPASGRQTTPSVLTTPLSPLGNAAAILLRRLRAGVMEE